MKRERKWLQVFAVLALLSVMPSMADDVTDTIEDALAAYKEGDKAGAKEDLAYALELIKQQKGDTMKSYLPEPLDGWSAESVKSQTAGAAMFGGGTTVSRVYKKGDARVEINIVTDSPLMQSIGGMFANPMFAAGGKLKRIKREKAMIEYNPDRHNGKVTLMVANRFLVTVEGRNISEDDLVSYTRAIDFKALKKL